MRNKSNFPKVVMILCIVFIVFIGISQLFNARNNSTSQEPQSSNGFVSDLTEHQYNRLFSDDNYIPFPEEKISIKSTIDIKTESGRIYSLGDKLIVELKDNYSDIDVSTTKRAIMQLGIDPESNFVDWR